MRSTIAIATFLAVGAGAAGVGAAINLSGSDTLKDLTIFMLTQPSPPDCGGTGQSGTLSYAGGGSGNGQAAMLAATQNIAPMSSQLSSCGSGGQLATSEGIGFELDGLSVLADAPTMGSGTCNGAGTANTCTPDSGHTEGGIAFGGSGKVITPDATIGCNADADCNDPTSGRAGIFGEFCDLTVPVSGKNGTCKYDFGSDSNIAGWKKALRILFFGQSDNSTANATNINHRNCQSPERKFLANHWTALMQNCPGGDTTCPAGIRHAFRRNDESGTTDVFKGLLTTPGPSQGNNIAAFCNTGTRGPEYNLASPPDKPCTADSQCVASVTGSCDTTAGKCRVTLKSPQRLVGSIPPGGSVNEGFPNNIAPTATSPVVINMDYLGTTITECIDPAAGGNASGYKGSYFTDLQDYDPVRRACQGNGLASATGASEDVCSTRGDLGLVLPIWDIPAASGGTGAPVTDAFPTTGCSTGVFTCVAAVQTSCAGVTPVTYERCPDGSNPNDPATDSTAPPTGTNLCPIGQCAAPAIQASTLDPRCQAGKGANWAAQDPVSLKTIIWDGRAYNLTSWTTAGPTFKRIALKRASGLAVTTGSAVGPTANVNMVGAYYRIHAIHTMDSTGATATCKKPSATDNIGCLVHASPCSVGYAGNSGAVAGQSTGLKVNNVDPDNKCVQCFLDSTLCTGTAKRYELSRALYLNSIQGFESLTGSTDLTNEGKMATCYANGRAADIATGLGFIPLPATNATRDNTGSATTPNDPSMQLPNLTYTRGKSYCYIPTCATGDPCSNNTGSIPSCHFGDSSTGTCSFGP